MVLNLNDLVDLTVNKLADIVKLKNAAILLRGEGDNEIKTVAATGVENHEHTLAREDELLEYIDKGREYIVLESAGQKTSASKKIKKKMHELSSELAIPLTHRKDIIGL